MPILNHTITKDELAEKLARGERIQVINVVEPPAHILGSIPGSKRIPLSVLDQRTAELDKSSEVVAYAAGYESRAARRAVEILVEAGFNAAAYEGGIKEWQESGLPLE